jgi:hypothetical protein
MTLLDDLKTSLTGNTAVMAALTGGVHIDTLISRQTTAAAFDTNLEIKPCALVKIGVETAVPPHHRGSRAFVEVYLYQFSGYTTIRTARDLIYTLWHEQRIGAGVWQMFSTDDVNDQVDDALKCSLILSRYVVVRLR